MMISPKKLIKMAIKWQRVAVLRRKHISFPRKIDEFSSISGHFIVYTADKERFAFPISCLNSLIFRELLRMSEEEFGLPSGGPITLPCDSQFMAYVYSLMQNNATEDVEKALLLSIDASR